MKISKNVRLDVGYVEFRKGRVGKTFELMPGVLFDFSKKGDLLGIEVLSLRRVAPSLRGGLRKKAA